MKYLLITLSVLFFGIGVAMSYLPADQFIEAGSITAVLFLSLPAFYGMWKIYRKSGVLAIIGLGLLALTIETIGIHTGFPYSHFDYIMPFGYRILGTTPWTVFIAWSPLVIGAYLLAQSWFKQWWSRILIYLGLLIGTDLVLDPGAVARGLWQYESLGLWYNVPLQNFLGWIFSGLIAYAILKFGLSEITMSSKNLIMGSLSLILSITLWSGVTFGYNIWLPAIIGIILSIIIIFRLIKKPSLK